MKTSSTLFEHCSAAQPLTHFHVNTFGTHTLRFSSNPLQASYIMQPQIMYSNSHSAFGGIEEQWVFGFRASYFMHLGTAAPMFCIHLCDFCKMDYTTVRLCPESITNNSQSTLFRLCSGSWYRETKVIKYIRLYLYAHI